MESYFIIKFLLFGFPTSLCLRTATFFSPKMKHRNGGEVDESFIHPPTEWELGEQGFTQTTDSLNETLILIYGRGQTEKNIDGGAAWQWWRRGVEKN